MDRSQSILARLMAVIEDRKANPSEKSYTNRLLAGGVAKIGAKIVEEAAEVVAAAAEPGPAGRTHTIHEAADVIYHLFVLLGCRDISLGRSRSRAGPAVRHLGPGRKGLAHPRHASGGRLHE